MNNTVILIDDDEDDLELLHESIMTANPAMNCLKFTDSVDAVVFICDGLLIAPDYVFTDINMPRMSGEQVVTELRKTNVLDELVICVLSTSIQDGVEQKLTA